MIRLFISAMLCCQTACVTQAADKTMVLHYDDFGPPSAAHELIGMDWWQWQPHGDARPRRYDIKVVVYRDIEPRQVRQAFPTDPLREQDYRYVGFTDAMRYLERMITDSAIESITQRLIETRERIIGTLGEP